MSSVCGRLDLKDAVSHLESSSASSPNKCSNGSKRIFSIGSENSQESDGDDSGYIHQNVNEESKDKAISNPISESLDDEGEGKNLATALEDMFSESMSVVTLIPLIKGGRERHGKSLEKLNVSWAEDVYDPPPSIVSHTRSKKQQPQKSKSSLHLRAECNVKKNVKKGQKGNSYSRGASKAKKQSSSSRSKHSRDKFDWTTQMPIVAASS